MSSFKRLRDYVLTTSTLNVVEQSVWYYDKEHTDIHFPDGGSLSDIINPKPEVIPEDTTAIINMAIAGIAIAI